MIMNYYIKIGAYTINLIDSIFVKKSVELLSDTCVITLPGSFVNKSNNIETIIKEGDAVEIKFGYDNDIVTEFKGYVNSISTKEFSIEIECEDNIHIFRKELKDAQLTKLTLKEVLQHIVKEIDPSYTVKCDYDFSYDKYVIYQATGYDVLKKVQSETKANVYFKDKVLHVHPQYSEIINDKPVIFDFTKNIEKSNLQYKTADQRKYLLEVESIGLDGKRITTSVGKPGGDKRSVKIYGVTDIASLKKRAEEELRLVVYTGFEGNFVGWLKPYVEPTYKIRLQDCEYPQHTGNYYVVATDTKFSSSGGERTITLGYKIGVA